MKLKSNTKKMILSSLFIAIGIVLPFVTMQIPSIGNMLCPMHIPVLLCGFICGWPYALIVGFILPLLRSMMFGVPVLMPAAVAMSFELAAYGLVSGLMNSLMKGRRFRTYISLITAMISGRIVWGAVSFILFNILGNKFTINLFLMQSFVNAVPGIIIQLIFIPMLVSRLQTEEVRGVSYGR